MINNVNLTKREARILLLALNMKADEECDVRDYSGLFIKLESVLL